MKSNYQRAFTVPLLLIVILVIATTVGSLFILYNARRGNDTAVGIREKLRYEPAVRRLTPRGEVRNSAAVPTIVPDAKTGAPVLVAGTSRYVVDVGGNTNSFSVHAYDSSGRHTGPRTSWTSQLPLIEQQIPNSTLERAGSWHLTLDTQDDYRVEIDGAATGLYNLEISMTPTGTESARTVRYAGGRLTAGLRASLALSRGGFREPPELIIDLDGDGKPDVRQAPMEVR
jgi:hypothetical protein